jgi:hypothetical protein
MHPACARNIRVLCAGFFVAAVRANGITGLLERMI